MSENAQFLKMRILCRLLRISKSDATVTYMAKSFSVEKYSISRALSALEKEGLLYRENRLAMLTHRGHYVAEKFAERMEIATNYLIYEGIPEAQVMKDAMYISMFFSDEAFNAIRKIEERYRIKHALNNVKKFYGDELCKSLRDGDYNLPFMIYRTNMKDGNNISMANNGFQHPCILSIKNGFGTVILRAQEVSSKSALSKKLMKGKVESFKYFYIDKFYEVEKNGNLLVMPASALHFINLGRNSDKILYGSVAIKLTCSVGSLHMPESTAILTLQI
ncbi:hypothetical protein ACGCUQ_05330 [Eubacteriales bacterium KG127]